VADAADVALPPHSIIAQAGFVAGYSEGKYLSFDQWVLKLDNTASKCALVQKSLDTISN